MNIEGYIPGRRAVILGSGDIGLIMARRMTLEGAKVLAVCEIMPYSGGLARNIVQCLDDFGIPLKLSHTIVNIHGKERVEGVTVAAVDEQNGRRPIPGTEEYIECDTVLLSVGLIPENELTRGAGITINPTTSGACVNQNRETETAGIYSCGNVLHVHDLVDFVSEEAEIAGHSAAERILNGSAVIQKTVLLKAEGGIRYTVPERLDLSAENQNVRIFFRVSNVYKKVTLTAETSEGTVLAKRVKSAVAPGEMESLEITAEALNALASSSCDSVIVKLTENGDTKQ